MRVFIAIPLPAAVQAAAAELQQVFRALPLEGTWVRMSNLHLTLKFIGEVEPAQIDGIIAAMAHATRRCAPFSVALVGVGVFPNVSKPRVLWAGIEDGAQRLKQLHQELESQLEAIGFPPEGRPFTPHLTLARLRHVAERQELVKCLERYRRSNIGKIVIDHVELMESQLHPAGAIYSTVTAVPLTGGDTTDRSQD